MTLARRPHPPAALANRRFISAIFAVLGAFFLATTAIAQASTVRSDLLRSGVGRDLPAGSARASDRTRMHRKRANRRKAGRHSQRLRARNRWRKFRHARHAGISSNKPVETDASVGLVESGASSPIPAQTSTPAPAPDPAPAPTSDPAPAPVPDPAPAPAPESTNSPPAWHGDFETGDLSQWETWQEVALDRITASAGPRPARQLRRSLRSKARRQHRRHLATRRARDRSSRERR